MSVKRLKGKQRCDCDFAMLMGEIDELDPKPRGYKGTGDGICCVYYWTDRRKTNRKWANLYYLERVLRTRTNISASIMVSGWPFLHYINTNGNNLPLRTEAEWWALVTNNHTVSIEGQYYYASLAQYLGKSHEIQYCARLLDVPYDIVGIIELLILAIL